MSDERIKKYLMNFVQRNPQEQQSLLPLIMNWENLLQQIPGLKKKNPGRHCRIAEFSNSQVLIDADHPGWLQLLQLHEKELLNLLQSKFHELHIQGIHFRLVRDEKDLQSRAIREPEPVKEAISMAEQEQIESLLKELEGLVKKRD